MASIYPASTSVASNCNRPASTRRLSKAQISKAQKCCGAPHTGEGDMETLKLLARHNVDLFNGYELDYIVALGANAAKRGSTWIDLGTPTLWHDGHWYMPVSALSG